MYVIIFVIETISINTDDFKKSSHPEVFEIKYSVCDKMKIQYFLCKRKKKTKKQRVIIS